MMRDRGFLLAASALVGEPLIPHPIRDAAVQVNFYGPARQDEGGPDVAKWHQNGMNYAP